ncbi:MAG: hypothetical protein JW934_20270 [Anaerolineae bacterium]|nr:hypothetical protein [Anaerolineae bacterium]
MLGKEYYANGQRVYQLEENILTYYFKNGAIKAAGRYQDGQMEGEWRFYRETGALWQIGHLKNGKKHGTWIRYSKENRIEYEAIFIDGKEKK